MERVTTSSEATKNRFVQFNGRVFSVGGVTTTGGLERRTSCSLSDEQKMFDDEQHRHGDYQQQQQQQYLDQTQQSCISSMAAAEDDASRCRSPSTVAATTQRDALTTVTRFSWSSDSDARLQTSCQSPAAAPPIAPPTGSVCQGSSLSQQQSNDQLVFEDGLTHLRNLYETRLASSRSASLSYTLSVSRVCP